MGEIIQRAATEADISEAARLFITSVGDLAKRYGLSPPIFTAESIEPVYRHIHRTGIFDVAEVDGKIVAICHAIVQDDLWFLSGFWAQPGLQRKGVGGPLLRRVLAEGQRRGAKLSFTWSSVDTTAMATYMKVGMLPGTQILTFTGAPSLPEPGREYEELALDVRAAGDIDAVIRGTRREVDHAFLLAGASAAKLVLRGGRPVGYYYVNRGLVGPAGWLDLADGEEVFHRALHEARRVAPEVRVALPGRNHTAIQKALAAGLKLIAFTHLLCSAEPGQMDRYVPSGPSLF